MKIWVDDIRPAPIGYVWRKSVNAVRRLIKENERFDTLHLNTIELIDLDHDSGDFVYECGAHMDEV